MIVQSKLMFAKSRVVYFVTAFFLIVLHLNLWSILSSAKDIVWYPLFVCQQL